MGFWEPSTVTFKFLDFEITHTLEKFSSLTELLIRGRLPMIPSVICTGDFLNLLDLYIFRSFRYVDGEKVELDYLFQRFGRLEGYDEYQHEFSCICEAWVHMRPRVFIMAFLGIMVFSIKSHSVDINILPMVISIFNNPILLQIWVREHFYHRDPQMDYYIGACNKIESHEDRLRNWAFTLVSLEWIRNMQAEWEYVIDLDIREESWCTPEYYAWQNVVSHMAHPSVRGHQGFVDNQQIDWVRESVFPRMGFTTPMYNQIVPGSIDYLIQEDPEEDPEEEVEEDHMEVSETGSNIYDPRDGGVINMSPEHSLEESPEYHPRPYYDGDDDDDDAPTWP
ncbi:hypothetical protein H5410_031320 [Solanum commersonii]|uniref:Uncharacterized protein n=1 Tax=Solanum commersonii TaxID=4109 RepID=A0A9J5YLY7_SOLCO|nr:hypothetical protein H5410_031320 [Solanum commersonii]